MNTTDSIEYPHNNLMRQFLNRFFRKPFEAQFLRLFYLNPACSRVTRAIADQSNFSLPKFMLMSNLS